MKDNSDEKDLNALYTAIGYLVTIWALMEQGLDATVAQLFHNYGGKSPKKRLPIGLKNKIAFVNSCFAASPALVARADEVRQLMNDVTVLRRKRDDLVHAAMTKLTHDNGVFNFRRLDARKDMHHIVNVSIDMKQFPALATSFVELSKKVHALADSLFSETAA